MRKIEEIKRIVREHKQELQRKYKVKEIGIFGSYIRGEEKDISDVDILIDFEEAPTLIKFINLENYLSDLLGVKVDLVMKKALKPYIGKVILNEVVLV